MMKFRVFVQDVGRTGYSGLRDISVASVADARKRMRKLRAACDARLIAISHGNKDQWPDGKTGQVPADADCI